MAENADGSIIIDTEIDDTGFVRGSDKLRNAVRSLVGSINNIGETVKSTFSRAAPNIANLGKTVQQTTSEISDAGRKADAAGTQMANALNSAQFNKQADGIEKSCDSVINKLQSLGDKARKGLNSDAQKLDFQIKLEHVGDTITQLQNKLTALGSKRFNTAQYDELLRQLDAADKKMQSLYERQERLQATGVSERSTRWQTLSKDIEYYGKQYDTLLEKIQKLRSSGGTFTSGQDTERFSALKSQFDSIIGRFQEYKSMLSGINTVEQPATAAASALGGIRGVLGRIAPAAAAAFTGIKTFGGILGTVASTALRVVATLGKLTFKGLKKSFELLGKAAKKTFSFIGKGVSSVVSKLNLFDRQGKKSVLSVNGLFKAFTSLKRMLISRIKRMFLSAVINEVREDIKLLAKFSETFDNSMSNIKNRSSELAANLTVTLSNLITAVEPILTRIIDALSNVVSYFNSFIAMMTGKSTVITAKKQMQSYADSTDEAAKSVEELQNQVYSFDELNKRSSDKASGTDDEKKPEDVFEEIPLENALPDKVKAFLERLKDAFNVGDWYGAGMVIADGLNSAFSAVDNWITGTLQPEGVKWSGRIAEILNGLVDGTDWTLIGQTIGDGINTVAGIINKFLTTFNFENLGKGFAKSINGIFNTVDWDLLGRTIVNQWNALVKFIHGAVTNTNWSGIGNSLARFVQSMINAFNINLLADTISKGINGIVTMLQHFFDGVNWIELSANLTNGLNHILYDTNWSAIGNLLGSLINYVLSFIITAINTFDWFVLGQSISDFITAIDWNGISQRLSEGITSIFNAARNLIAGFNWTSIGTTVAGFLNNIDWVGMFASLGKLMSTGISAALDLLIAFVENTDWGKLGQSIWNSLVAMIKNIDWEKLVKLAFELVGAVVGAASSLALGLVKAVWKTITNAYESMKSYFARYIEEAGGNVVSGIFKGILDGIKNIATWIKKNIFEPFIKGFKAAFGISSPSKVMAEMGQYLVEGLLEGIKSVWNTVVSFFKDVLPEIASTLSNAWEEMKNTASAKWDEVKNAISGKWEEIKTATSSSGENLKTTISGVWDNIKNSASSKWDEIKSAVTNKAEKMRSELGNIDFRSVGKNLVDKIENGISNNWSNVKSTLSSNFNSLTRNLSVSKFIDVGEDIVNGIRRGIENGWSWVTNSIWNLCVDMYNNIVDFWDIGSPSKVTRKLFEYVDEGMINGVESKKNDVINTVSNLNGAIMDKFGEISPEMDLSPDIVMDDTVSSLTKIAEIFDRISAAIKNMGGLVTPKIAEGTVIPYKTRIDTTAPIKLDTSALEVATTGMDERMSDQTDLLRRILNALESKNLSIDVDALARATAKAQNKRAISFGSV